MRDTVRFVLIAATKTGNREDMRECLELAAQGRIKTHCQIRKMNELTQVSPDSFASGC